MLARLKLFFCTGALAALIPVSVLAQGPAPTPSASPESNIVSYVEYCAELKKAPDGKMVETGFLVSIPREYFLTDDGSLIPTGKQFDISLSYKGEPRGGFEAGHWRDIQGTEKLAKLLGLRGTYNSFAFNAKMGAVLKLEFFQEQGDTLRQTMTLVGVPGIADRSSVPVRCEEMD